MKEQLTLEMLCGYQPNPPKLIVDGKKCNLAYLSTKKLAYIETSGIGEVKKLSWKYVTGKVKPIFRNLATDLTREIEHNGKRFVPALKLAELMVERGLYKDIAPSIGFKYAMIQKPFGYMLKVTKVEDWVIMLSINEVDRAKYLIVQQLQKWHFWIYDQSFFDKKLILDINELNK